MFNIIKLLKLSITIFFGVVFSVQPLIGQERMDKLKEIDSLIFRGKEDLYSNPKNSLKFFHRAEELSEDIEDDQKMNESYTQLLICYLTTGLFEEATYYAYKKLSLAEKNDSAKEIAFAEFNLGSIWLALSKYEKAKVFFLKALEVINKEPVNVKDSVFAASKATILSNLSLAENGLNNLGSAKIYAEEGLELARLNSKITDQYLRLLNIYSQILIKLNESNAAKLALDESLSISKSVSFPSFEAVTYYSYAQLYLNQKDFNKAIIFAKYGLGIAQSLNNMGLVSSISNQLYISYLELNQPDSTLKYHLLQLKTDSLIKINSVKETMLRNELQGEFKKTMENSVKREKQKQLIFLSLMIILIGGLGFSGFVLRKKIKEARLAKSEQAKNLKVVHEISQKIDGLETELEEKKKELSFQTVKKLEKDKRIDELLNKLRTQGTAGKSAEINLKEELKLIQTDEDIFQEFDIIFSEIHSGFFKKLQTEFPNLTLSERRICAFLKLQMTTKEIAKITHQSIRSVEITRIRLRKKLNLTNSTINLSDFLTNY